MSRRGAKSIVTYEIILSRFKVCLPPPQAFPDRPSPVPSPVLALCGFLREQPAELAAFRPVVTRSAEVSQRLLIPTFHHLCL